MLYLLLGLAAAHVLMEQPGLPSSAWKVGARAAPGSTLTVHAMLKHDPADVRKLEKKLMDVSDPRSSHYGKHLSMEEVNQIVPIPTEQVNTVRSFFAGAEALKPTPGQDILTVTLTVAQAEALFDTEIFEFTHATRAVKLLRAHKYSLPDAVARAVYTIGDLTLLPRLSGPVAPLRAAIGQGNWTNACEGLVGCKGLITPAVLKARYNVPNDDTGMDVAGNNFAVAEFQGQYFKADDLQMFSSGCNTNVTVDRVIGGDVNSPGIEAELDIQYIRGVSDKIPLTMVYDATFSLLNYFTVLNGRADAEWIHSVSYGNDEAQQTGTPYMESCNVQFMKAGTRGISIMFASGDQGVCGREGCGLINKKFHPDFPAGSPYITSVGGTDFRTLNIGEETTWDGSGGGFSDTFPIPDWQAQAVAAYKAAPDANLPNANYWNNTGRGYPDIAALGGQKTPYCIVTNSRTTGVAGTSAACPVAASIFARLNGLRLKAGKPPLGWLNPFIYQNPTAFNDVTSGKNTGGSGLGFNAIAGWDPATGWGSPNFEELSKLI